MEKIENTENIENIEAKPKKFFVGYRMVALTFIAVLCGGSITYVGSYINSMMVLSEGLSKTVIGNTGSLINLTTMLFGTLFGSLMVKYGHRAVMMLGLIAGSIGFVALAMLPVIPLRYTLMYIPLGLCISLICKIGGPSLANVWFNRRKALPVALIIAGGSFGGVFSGFVSNLMNSTGTWRTGWWFMLGFAVVAMICVMFVSDDVKGHGEIRDGKHWTKEHGYPVEDEVVLKAGAAKKIKINPFKYYKNPRFFFLSFSCFLRMAIFATGASYITLTVMERGLTKEQAAYSVAYFAVSSTIGRLSGPVWPLLRINNLTANRIAFLMCGVGGLLLSFSTNLTILTLAVILIGAGYGVGYTTQTLLISDLYPKDDFSILFGAFTQMVTLASVIMGTLAGLIGEALGVYSPIYQVLGIACIILALSFGYVVPKKTDPPLTEQAE